MYIGWNKEIDIFIEGFSKQILSLYFKGYLSSRIFYMFTYLFFPKILSKTPKSLFSTFKYVVIVGFSITSYP